MDFISKYFTNSTSYDTLNTNLKGQFKGSHAALYKVVRCGLVHEYFMKADSQVSSGVP
jgi:hypothetical protein